MNHVKALLLLVLSNLAASSSLLKIHVDPDTGHFVDEVGRVRMLRGINSVKKEFPYYEERMLEDERIEELESLGMNVVRLGTMWTGWQPTGANSVNESYVQIQKLLVEKFAGHGIYTVLDAHQDGLWKAGSEGSANRGYWGVPPWVKSKLLDEQTAAWPWPYVSVQNWECEYFTQEVSRGFQKLYHNVNGTADDFANFWASVAENFKSSPSILGYELMNEPFAGDFFNDSQILFSGVAGSENLEPFYNRLSKAIRRHDKEALVFWEPVIYGYYFPIPSATDQFFLDHGRDFLDKYFVVGTQFYCGKLQQDARDSLFRRAPALEEKFHKIHGGVWGPGLSAPPGGPEYANKSVMSWHHYCLIPTSNQASTPLTKAFCDDIFGPMVFKTAGYHARNIGGGRMLTEFGDARPNISQPETRNTQEVMSVLEMAEVNFESWIYWDSLRFWSDDDGPLPEEVALVFARPYPMATNGVPFKLKFDIWSKTMSYSYRIKAGVGSKEFPTEIFVPELHYPGRSYRVSLSKGLAWRAEGNVVKIFHDPSRTKDGQLVHVGIKPTT